MRGLRYSSVLLRAHGWGSGSAWASRFEGHVQRNSWPAPPPSRVRRSVQSLLLMGVSLAATPSARSGRLTNKAIQLSLSARDLLFTHSQSILKLLPVLRPQQQERSGLNGPTLRPRGEITSHTNLPISSRNGKTMGTGKKPPTTFWPFMAESDGIT